MGGHDHQAQARKEDEGTVNRHLLTPDENRLFDVMLRNWAGLLGRNRERMRHLEGKVTVRDLGISIPPPMRRRLQRCSVMWAHQAVHRVADASTIRRFSMPQGDGIGLADMLAQNDVEGQYDEIQPSQLAHGPAFFTVTAGGAGEPAAIVASYDAEHATAIYDYRRRRMLAGLTIVDVDPYQPDRATAANFFSPDGTVVEMERNMTGGWRSRRRRGATGRCMMVAMVNEPTRLKPFGTSAITPAIMSLEDEMNREAVRMALQAEIFTAPTRWVMGADDDIFANKARWEAYLGSIFALPVNEEGEAPKTGQYPQGDMQPHISYVRQLANQFAAEAKIPIHSLLYTDANPASAEAIEASRNDLVEKVLSANRQNARALHDVAMLVASIVTETPVADLPHEITSLEVKFSNPQHTTLSARADAAQKTAQSVPGFTKTRAYWRMSGFDEDEIDEVLSDLDRIEAQSSLEALGGRDDEKTPTLLEDEG